MTANSFIRDEDFESLVEALRSIMLNARPGVIERWEIRLALADNGILPLRMVDGIEDEMVEALRGVAIANISEAGLRAA